MNRFFVLVVGLLGAGAAFADEQTVQVEYSGIMTMETSAGVMTGPYAYTPQKERREMNVEGSNMITITRRDRGVMWMLMPEQKMYMEHALGAENTQAPSDLSDYTIEASDVGPEDLDGIPTTKSKVIMTAKDGTKFGGFSWRTDEGIVVKTDAIAMAEGTKQRIRMELTELSVGPQPAELFEIPEGFSSMNMGSMMLQGLSGQTGPEAAPEGAPDGAPSGVEEAPPKKKWGLKSAMDLLK